MSAVSPTESVKEDGRFPAEAASYSPTKTTNTRLLFSAVGGLAGLGWGKDARGVSIFQSVWGWSVLL